MTDRGTRARRSSCPSTTRARPSSPSCARCRRDPPARDPRRLRLRRGHRRSRSSTAWPRELPGDPRPAQRPRPRRPQRDEGGHRGDDAATYVLVSMADGSDEPDVVDAMVELARGGADVVAASRYMQGGHQIGGPPLKRLMSRTAGLTLHGRRRPDPRPDQQLQALLAPVPRRDDDRERRPASSSPSSSPSRRRSAGRRIAEVPTTWRDRTAGQSNFKLRKWLPHYLHWYLAGATLAHPQEAIDQGMSMASGLATRSWLRRETGDTALGTDGGAYRPDLDGLRAVAVGLVMLAHAGCPGSTTVGTSGSPRSSSCRATSSRAAAPRTRADRRSSRPGRVLPSARDRRLGPALLGLLAFVIDAWASWRAGRPSGGSGSLACLGYVSNWVQCRGDQHRSARAHVVAGDRGAVLPAVAGASCSWSSASG